MVKRVAEISKELRISVLGLGEMGSAFTERLIRAGYNTTVWNRSLERSEPFLGRVAVAASAMDACDADIVLCVLYDDAAIESIALSEATLRALSPSATFVCMSTISLGLAVRLEKRFAERHLSYVSAPIFGRPESARIGAITVVTGGEKAAVARLEPVLQQLGNTKCVGAQPHVANLTKIGGNFLIGAALGALSECAAMLAGETEDASTPIDAICSILFASPIYESYAPVITGARQPTTRTGLALPLKDMRFAIAAGESSGTAMPLAHFIESKLIAAQTAGMGQEDWATALASMARASESLFSRRD